MVKLIRFLLRGFSNKEVEGDAIIILSSGRSGSTLLSSYLNSLKSIKSHGEILNPEVYPSNQLIDKLPFFETMTLARIKAFLNSEINCIDAVKIIFGQLRNISLERLYKNFPKVKFIILYRANLLETYVSLLRARKTQEWFTKDDKSETNDDRFLVRKDELLEFCRRLKGRHINLNETLLLSNALVVSYKELSNNPETLFSKKICPYLNIKYKPVRSALKKQMRKPLREAIENFHEIEGLINSPAAILNFDDTSKRFS